MSDINRKMEGRSVPGLSARTLGTGRSERGAAVRGDSEGRHASCMTQVKKVVRPWPSLGQKRVFVRFKTAPGEQTQMDWGHFGNYRGKRLHALP